MAETVLFHEQLKSIASAIPTAIAARSANLSEELSYQDLIKQSNQLARYLFSLIRDKDSGFENAGPVVGVHLPADIPWLKTLVGVWQAGMTYAPLSNDTNEVKDEKLKAIVKNANVKLIITSSNDYAERQGFFDSLGANVEVVVLEQVQRQISGFKDDELDEAETFWKDVEEPFQRLAYIISTSGSTGAPKQVFLNHSGLVPAGRDLAAYIKAGNSIAESADNRSNLEFLKLVEDEYKKVKSQRMAEPFFQREVMGLIVRIAFDAHLGGLVRSLATGATLQFIKDELLAKPCELVEFLNEAKVTTTSITPNLLKQLPIGQLETLTSIISMGGKALQPSLEAINALNEIRKEAGKPRLTFFNGIGLTEAFIANKMTVCLNDIHLGIPMQGVIGLAAYTVRLATDNELEQAGLDPSDGGPYYRLILTGRNGLARGYGDSVLTNERFFENESGEREYQTDDIVILNEGRLEFVRRLGRAVKLYEKFFDPGEFESKFSEMFGVDVCLDIQFIDGHPDISCYLFTNQNLDLLAVYNRLAEYFPPTSIPRHWYFISKHKSDFTRGDKLGWDYPKLKQEIEDIHARYVRQKDFKLYRFAKEELEPGTPGFEYFNTYLHLDDWLCRTLNIVPEAIKGYSDKDHLKYFSVASMKQLDLLRELEDKFGIKLEVKSQEGLRFVDIRHALYRKICEVQEERLISCVNPGDDNPNKLPVFLLPSLTGSAAMDWQQIKEHMGLDSDRKLYALDFEDDLELLPESVSDLAEQYARLIRKACNKGTYLLAGLSAGGLFAKEVAKALMSQGMLASVVMVDTENPANKFLLEPQQFWRELKKIVKNGLGVLKVENDKVDSIKHIPGLTDHVAIVEQFFEALVELDSVNKQSYRKLESIILCSLDCAYDDGFRFHLLSASKTVQKCNKDAALSWDKSVLIDDPIILDDLEHLELATKGARAVALKLFGTLGDDGLFAKEQKNLEKVKRLSVHRKRLQDGLKLEELKLRRAADGLLGDGRIEESSAEHIAPLVITRAGMSDSSRFFARHTVEVSNVSRPGQLTFLEGDAGRGKTTLCQLLKYQWQNQMAFQGYDFLFSIKIRDVNGRLDNVSTLEDLLNVAYESFWHANLSYSRTEMDANKKTDVFKFILSDPERVVLVIDSVDELEASDEQVARLKQIILGARDAGLNVIVTSRPYSPIRFDDVSSHSNIHQGVRWFGFSKYQVAGFDLNGITSYVQHCYFRGDQRSADNFLAIVTRNSEVFDLCRTPLMAELICVLYSQGAREETLGLKASVYQEMLLVILKRFLSKSGIPTQKIIDFSLDDILNEFNQCNQFVSAMGLVGWSILLSGRRDFDRDFYENLEESEINWGPLKNMLEKVGMVSKGKGNHSYRFVHDSFITLFAARYWMTLFLNSKTRAQALNLFAENRYFDRFFEVWALIAEILNAACTSNLTLKRFLGRHGLPKSDDIADKKLLINSFLKALLSFPAEPLGTYDRLVWGSILSSVDPALVSQSIISSIATRIDALPRYTSSVLMTMAPKRKFKEAGWSDLIPNIMPEQEGDVDHAMLGGEFDRNVGEMSLDDMARHLVCVLNAEDNITVNRSNVRLGKSDIKSFINLAMVTYDALKPFKGLFDFKSLQKFYLSLEFEVVKGILQFEFGDKSQFNGADLMQFIDKYHQRLIDSMLRSAPKGADTIELQLDGDWVQSLFDRNKTTAELSAIATLLRFEFDEKSALEDFVKAEFLSRISTLFVVADKAGDFNTLASEMCQLTTLLWKFNHEVQAEFRTKIKSGLSENSPMTTLLWLIFSHDESSELVGFANNYPGPIKADGTPDMRYQSNRSRLNNYTPIVGDLPDLKQSKVVGMIGPNEVSMPARVPLRAGGTPDMRYSTNSFGCSYCGLPGHNIRTCPGRRERNEWAHGVDSGFNPLTFINMGGSFAKNPVEPCAKHFDRFVEQYGYDLPMIKSILRRDLQRGEQSIMLSFYHFYLQKNAADKYGVFVSVNDRAFIERLLKLFDRLKLFVIGYSHAEEFSAQIKRIEICDPTVRYMRELDTARLMVSEQASIADTIEGFKEQLTNPISLQEYLYIFMFLLMLSMEARAIKYYDENEFTRLISQASVKHDLTDYNQVVKMMAYAPWKSSMESSSSPYIDFVDCGLGMLVYHLREHLKQIEPVTLAKLLMRLQPRGFSETSDELYQASFNMFCELPIEVKIHCVTHITNLQPPKTDGVEDSRYMELLKEAVKRGYKSTLLAFELYQRGRVVDSVKMICAMLEQSCQAYQTRHGMTPIDMLKLAKGREYLSLVTGPGCELLQDYELFQEVRNVVETDLFARMSTDGSRPTHRRSASWPKF